jgi:hypothetical protein
MVPGHYRQCFVSGFIEYGSWSSVLGWIPIRIQGFDNKKFDIFFLSKNAIYLSLGHHKYVQVTGTAFGTFKTWKLTFFCFCGPFLPSWIRIRIHWSDWIRNQSGSGSKTLILGYSLDHSPISTWIILSFTEANRYGIDYSVPYLVPSIFIEPFIITKFWGACTLITFMYVEQRNCCRNTSDSVLQIIVNFVRITVWIVHLHTHISLVIKMVKWSERGNAENTCSNRSLWRSSVSGSRLPVSFKLHIKLKFDIDKKIVKNVKIPVINYFLQHSEK